jgi:hypothetical protein
MCTTFFIVLPRHIVDEGDNAVYKYLLEIERTHARTWERLLVMGAQWDEKDNWANETPPLSVRENDKAFIEAELHGMIKPVKPASLLSDYLAVLAPIRIGPWGESVMWWVDEDQDREEPCYWEWWRELLRDCEDDYLIRGAFADWDPEYPLPYRGR